MKALVLSSEGEGLLERFKDISLAPIVEDVPYDLEPVKRELSAGFDPAHNIFLTRFSVKMAERLSEFKEKVFRGAIAVNPWISEYLERLGVRAKLITKGGLAEYISRLNAPYAIWCSSADTPLKVSELGKVFVVHGLRENDSAFEMAATKVNEGAKFVIFTSAEEVYAWQRLEELYGEAVGIWAIAIGKPVAALVQSHTSMTKVLLFDGKLEDFPEFLKLFGIE